MARLAEDAGENPDALELTVEVPVATRQKQSSTAHFDLALGFRGGFRVIWPAHHGDSHLFSAVYGRTVAEVSSGFGRVEVCMTQHHWLDYVARELTPPCVPRANRTAA